MEKNEVKIILEKISKLKHNTHHENHQRRGHKAVLNYLYQNNGSSLSGDISKNVGISTPRLAVILKELETENLIKRTYQTDDKRKVTVNITQLGIQTMKEKQKKHEVFLNKLISKLNDEEIKVLLHIVDLIEEIENEKNS